MIERTILVFGDSIAYGQSDVQGGWVFRLRRFFEEHPNANATVYNLGIPSDTSREVLARFEHELKSRVKEGERAVIVFAVGINDAKFIYNEANVAPVPFRNNLQQLVDLAQPFALQTVFMGLTPVEESKTNPLPSEQHICYRNNVIMGYNQLMKDFCQERGVAFVDIYNEWLRQDYYVFLSEDGLHPNEAGHIKIFEQAKVVFGIM